MYSSISSSTYFFYVERPCVEDVMVAVTFHSPSEQSMKRKNFATCEINFWHYFVEIIEIAVVEKTSSTL
jgi:hypothetical protein